MKLLLSLFFFTSLLFPTTLEARSLESATGLLDETIRQNSYAAVIISMAIISLTVLLTFWRQEFSGKNKLFLFLGILIPTLATTLYLIGSTFYLNYVSVTKGPVHYHADFEIYDCGQKVDLINPKGFSNKIGTETFHEHNDNRLHVEGVVLNRKAINLGRFFSLVGGQLTSNRLQLPTDTTLLILDNGTLCNDEPGFVQVFVYSTRGNTYSQTKLTDPASYILSPHSNVPPGDCVIVEFSRWKEKTDHLCTSYQAQKLKGNFYGN